MFKTGRCGSKRTRMLHSNGAVNASEPLAYDGVQGLWIADGTQIDDEFVISCRIGEQIAIRRRLIAVRADTRPDVGVSTLVRFSR